jgi:NAD dependent epimerase/dehydratase family enzyme
MKENKTIKCSKVQWEKWIEVLITEKLISEKLLWMDHLIVEIAGKAFLKRTIWNNRKKDYIMKSKCTLRVKLIKLVILVIDKKVRGNKIKLLIFRVKEIKKKKTK